MDRVQFHAARIFLAKHLILIIDDHIESFFYDFCQKNKDSLARSLSSQPSIHFCLDDRGCLASILDRLSFQEKESLPCTYYQEKNQSNQLRTHILLKQEGLKSLERFLDQMTCFIAIYGQDFIEQDFSSRPILSQQLYS